MIELYLAALVFPIYVLVYVSIERSVEKLRKERDDIFK